MAVAMLSQASWQMGREDEHPQKIRGADGSRLPWLQEGTCLADRVLGLSVDPAPSSPPVDTDENVVPHGLVCFSCRGEESGNAFWFPFLFGMEGPLCVLKN